MPKPDFDSEKAYYWMKAVKQQDTNKMPHKEAKDKKERDFYRQVNQRLSRRIFS